MKKFLYLLIFSLWAINNLNSQTNSTLSDNRIHKVVEALPYFDSSICSALIGKQKLGCAENAMFDFVYSEISFPDEARKNKIEGMVKIKFVVEKNGSLSNFEILKDLEKGCGIEALNAVKKIKKFVPAQLNGNPVRTNYYLPIKFSLEKMKN